MVLAIVDNNAAVNTCWSRRQMSSVACSRSLPLHSNMYSFYNIHYYAARWRSVQLCQGYDYSQRSRNRVRLLRLLILILLLLVSATQLWCRCGKHSSPPASSFVDIIMCNLVVKLPQFTQFINLCVCLLRILPVGAISSICLPITS